jgi:hypothetical protein
MKTTRHREKTESPDNLWQAALKVIWAWPPVLRNIILILLLGLGGILVVWGTLPDKTRTDMIAMVWPLNRTSPASNNPTPNNPASNNPTKNPASNNSASENIAVSVELPSDVSEADLVVKTGGKEFLTISLRGHERQTLNLPAGSYTYELTGIVKFQEFQKPLKPCDEPFHNPTQGSFVVHKARNNAIPLPRELDGFRPIPGCRRSFNRPTTH